MDVACSTEATRLIENSYKILVAKVKACGYLEDLELDVLK